MSLMSAAKSALIGLGLLAVAWPAQAASNAGDVLSCHAYTSAAYLCDAVGGCNRNLKLSRRRLDLTAHCVQGLLECDLLERSGSPRAASCPESAARRCDRRQIRMDNFVKFSVIPLRQTGVERCAKIDFNADFLAGGPLGLGYAANATTCAGLGVSLTSTEDYYTCGDTRDQQLYAQILSLAAPRTRELLEDSGWCSLFPNEGGPSSVCNGGFLPRPSGVGSTVPIKDGQIKRCQKALPRGHRKILAEHLDLLEHCSEDYLQCDLKQAYGELNSAQFDACIANAVTRCNRIQDARDAKIPREIDKMKQKCAAVPFSELVDVMGFGDIAASCNADTVDEVIDCITAIECIAWQIASFPEARITEYTPPAYLSDYQACQ
jgi:hypothetical protein